MKNNRLLYLAKEYHLVVNDEFQLFYQGIIRSLKPEKYNVFIECEKGIPYNRYFTYTPKEEDEGSYELSVTLFEDNGDIIDKATTVLKVIKAVAPKTKKTVLCFGDSLTFNGVWPAEGYRRVTKRDGVPKGLGFSDALNFIGTCKKEVDGDIIGFEGYGGWQWKHFCTNEIVSSNSCVWIDCNHQLTEADQHSIWKSDDLLWVVESIENNRIKFKRGVGNNSLTPSIGKVFNHFDGGVTHTDILVKGFEFEKGNPFYNKEKNHIDFKSYVMKQNYDTLDFVYVLLTWNGQYIPFNHSLAMHEEYIRTLIDQIHNDFPLCKVRILGIQSPSITGGIAANYGAHGLYSNTFGDLSTCYYYNENLENLCNQPEYKDFVKFVDTKAQFDTEYNMPYQMMPVNSRSKILERVGNNGVHPNMDGYLQIGDVFYRILVHDLHE